MYHRRFTLSPRGLIALGSLLLLLFGGCASLTPPPPDPMAKKPYKKELEENVPTARTSDFSDALRQLGIMMGEYPTLANGVSIRGEGFTSVANAADLPVNINHMVATAMSRIGRQMSYQHVDTDTLGMYSAAHGNQAAQNLLVAQILATVENTRAAASDATPAGGSGARSGPPPSVNSRFVPPAVRYADVTYILRGGIVEFDTKVETEGRRADIRGTLPGKGLEGGGTIDVDRQVDRITIDFAVSHAEGQIGVPFANSSNSGKALQYSASGDVSVYLLGSGIGGGGRRAVSNGKHTMVRELVEFGVLRVVGRLTATPWWRCVPGGEPDPVVYDRLRGSTAELFQHPETTIGIVQMLLQKSGHRNVTVTKTKDIPTAIAIREMRARLGMPINEVIDQEFFMNLWLSLPMPWEKPGASSAFTAPVMRPSAAVVHIESAATAAPAGALRAELFTVNLVNFGEAHEAALRKILSGVAYSGAEAPKFETKRNPWGTRFLQSRFHAISGADQLAASVAEQVNAHFGGAKVCKLDRMSQNILEFVYVPSH